MKIGVLGANGFIGKEIVNILCKNHDVVQITRDNYNSYMGEYFDIFVNANGNSKRFLAEADPIFDFDASVTTTYKTLFDFKFDRYIYISSLDAYKDNMYGINKRISEFMLRDRLWSNVCILRVGCVVGKEAVKGVLYDIMNGKKLRVTSTSVYQLISSIDVANVVDCVIHNNVFDWFPFVFAVAGTPISVEDVIKLTGKSVEFEDVTIYQSYMYSTEDIEKHYKLKTSEDYIKELL